MNESNIGRRTFMQVSAASVAGAALTGAADVVRDGDTTTEVGKTVVEQITTKTEVLVVGGGTAGTVAALQAARAGAKTLLVERGAQLGGTTTTGGVAFPGLFDAWGKQVIAGIGWELVKDSVDLDGGVFPDFSKVPDHHWQNQVIVNPFLYAILAEEKCEQAGVEIAYYEFPESITANLTGRKDVLKKVRKKNKRLTHVQPEASFRESYRIQGETLITVEDYTSGRVFEDAICYAFYPVDLHTKNGVKPAPLARGTVPTIPLRALVPKGSKNIIVAGRCVSSDRLANSGLRVQASCMAMGQAAGATAVLAVEGNTTPLQVPLTKIHDMLRKHGAIVPVASST